MQSVVYSAAQFLARLEMRHIFAIEFDRITGFRVSPDSRSPIVQAKTAKAPDLNTLTAGELLRHHFENAFHSKINITGLQLILLEGYSINEF